MPSIIIENDSSVTLTIMLNNQPAVNLLSDAGTPPSWSSEINRGDTIELTNSSGKVTLDGYALVSDYSYLSVIDDANGKYKSFNQSQSLGPNTTIPYGKNASKELFMSFIPPYFIELTGSSPGTFKQIDGKKYIVNPSNPPSTTASHWGLYVFLIILFVLISIFVGLFVVYKRKSSKKF